MRSKLVLKRGMTRLIVNTLGSMSKKRKSVPGARRTSIQRHAKEQFGGGTRGELLMRHEYFKPIDHLRQRDRPVFLPIFERLSIVDIDNEILFLALKMHLGLLGVSTSHLVLLRGGVTACAV